MYIENLIARLSNCGQYLFEPLLRLSPYDISVAHSLGIQTDSRIALTEKQSMLALRLLVKYQDQLCDALGMDIKPSLTSPAYQLGIRKIDTARSISIDPAASVIQVSFPYSIELIEMIRAYKVTNQLAGNSAHEIIWDAENKKWRFPLREDHMLFLSDSMMPLGFDVDELFMEYINQIKLIQQNLEHFVPMLTYVNGEFQFQNTHAAVPNPDTTDVIQALFHAKRHGISTWDDHVAHMMKLCNLDSVTHRVLSNTNGIVTVASSKPISVLSTAIKYCNSTLFIIPGGNELPSLIACVNLLNSMGIDKSDMSVMFRLDNTTGKVFNQYIKTNSLNNPICENTRAVFVMGKIPKPLVESRVQFDMIVNLGINSPHYTLKNYVKNHHCVVNYNLVNPTGALDFDNM